MNWWASRPGRRWLARVLLLSLYAGALGWDGPAYGKVNPLEAISRQIQKVNMLVVLDTSGSMTGVPGGAFGSGTEVGVDCDDGTDCRTAQKAGTCSLNTSRTCTSDDDCAAGLCQSGDPCLTDADCPKSNGTCSSSGVSCTSNSDCSPASGTCSVNGSACSSIQPCANGGVCQYGGATCNNIGGTCATKYCSNASTTVCSTNADCPSTISGQIGHWKFDGNGTDSSGTGNNASAVGAPSYTTGKYNNSVTISTGNYMSVPDSASIDGITSAFTIATWVYQTVADNGGFVNIMNRQIAGQTIEHFGLAITSQYPRLVCQGAGYHFWEGSQIPLNTWTHIVVSYGGGQQKAYFNGVLQKTVAGTCSGLTADSTPVIIGAQNDNGTVGGYFPGRLDDLRLFNKALTDAEVTSLYNNTLGTSGVCNTNNCQSVTQTCSVGLNVCNAATANVCNGEGTAGTCNFTVTNATPVTMKMCRIKGNICASNSDCPTAGDTCVAASSRMSIAKRVLSNAMLKTHDLVNYGFMTFRQGGYYPYYQASSTASTTFTEYMPRERLEAQSCFSSATGPSSSCTINNGTYSVTYTLKGSSNSRYRVNAGSGVFNLVNNNWCGEACALGTGTGIYQGSHYDYTITTGSYAAGTAVSTRSAYDGRVVNVSGVNHTYWQPRTDYHSNGQNGTNNPPIWGSASCGAWDVCSATCGARWDTALSADLDVSGNSSTALSNVLTVVKRLDKAKNGGLMAEGNTPIGCALKNDGAASATKAYSAYHYMQSVKSRDTLTCRRNYVLLLTDGMANGPGDIDTNWSTVCATAACAAADPRAAGCTCRSVLAAQDLKALGVSTYVVGFSTDVGDGSTGKTVNDNIAKAGGTTKAFLASDETTLSDTIQTIIYDAIKGSYSTSPPTASAGTQLDNGVQMGTMAIDARVDFPSWKGNLIAYNVDVTPATLAWNAANVTFDAATDPLFWRKRRVYTSNGTTMVQIAVDQATGAITNASTLQTLGLGATTAEAERVAQWLLGKDNPAPLGAFVNSTPIDVGSPGKSSLPGGSAFYDTHKNRPSLIYVGSSDGMLHAFFRKQTVIGSTTFKAGSEAFAYIPPSMLRAMTKVYAQGGQRPSPKDHVFGLAASPKVKNLCVSGCTDAATAQWKTLLLMTEGYGGAEAFTLDITNPFTASGLANPPVSLQWGSWTATGSATFDSSFGQTISTPAFYFGKSSSYDDQRVIFASGYTMPGGATNQGKTIVNAQVRDGAILDTDTIAAPAGSCSRPYALLGDVATARNFNSGEKSQILAAYFGDTWGNLYRYVPTVDASLNTGATGSIATVEALGCNHPVHYAPGIVQLDRYDPANNANAIYIVQVTNSALDSDTTGLPASQLIIRKDVASAGVVSADTSFGDVGTPGKKVLTVGTTGLCAVMSGASCTTTLPVTARPTGTPMAVLKQDGSGFQIISLWFVPATTGCDKGKTYFVVHEVAASGAIVQKKGFKMADEPVTGTVVTAGKLVYIDSVSGVVDLTSGFGGSLVQWSPPAPTSSGGSRFRSLGWWEQM